MPFTSEQSGSTLLLFLLSLLFNDTVLLSLYTSVLGESMIMDYCWNDTDGKTEVIGGKPTLLPLCPLQMIRWIAWDECRSFAVGGRGRVALAVDRPQSFINPLKPELNPICYLLALLGAHHFLHVSRIRIKLLTLRRLMSYIWSTHSWCF